MKAIVSALLVLVPSQLPAQDDLVAGRIVCEVLSNRFVPTAGHDAAPRPDDGKGFNSGTTFIVDYVHDASGGMSIYLGEPNRSNILIEEPFPTASFRGYSRVTRLAEYRNAYSAMSLGRHSVNYKGKDQLFLREICSGGDWSGHFVQTYVSGRYTQVVSLSCSPFVDAIDDVLGRLETVAGH